MDLLYVSYASGIETNVDLEDQFQIFFQTFNFCCPFTTLVKESRHAWSLFGQNIAIEAAIKQQVLTSTI